MQFFKFTVLLFIFFCAELQAQMIIPTTIKPFSIGETIEFHSTILDENRALNIYLPNGYSPDSLKKYPVIYLLDGSVDEDFIHIVGLVQFGSFSWIEMIPESIVVGIANIDRKRDFTFPTNNVKDKADFPTTGGSEKFIQFIESELQPFIESNYKTDSVKTIIGQSLGGLLATEILLKKPELFDNYIIVSPSLWWDDESLLKQIPANFEGNKSIYIGVGKEGKVMENDAKNLYKKLNCLKNIKAKIYFEFFNEQSHADALHLAVYNAFEKIFKVEKAH
jgi:predicted alpha/beta superfamily hydrolase